MQKSGIDYFSLDVHLDDKFELIEAEFGSNGFAVVVKLFQKIYGEQGYYCEWTEEVALLFSRKCGLGRNVVSEIVSAAIKRGIFNKDLYDEYGILTSHGIQKRYFEATSRRKEVCAEKRYLLVNCAQEYENVRIFDKNVDISLENASIGEQSKVNKSKVNKSRVCACAPTREEVEAYCKSKGYSFAAKFYAHYQSKGWSMADWKAKADYWHLEDTERAGGNANSSFDNDEFFEAALKRGKELSDEV